jgi:hypothetical protein
VRLSAIKSTSTDKVAVTDRKKVIKETVESIAIKSEMDWQMVSNLFLFIVHSHTFFSIFCAACTRKRLERRWRSAQRRWRGWAICSTLPSETLSRKSQSLSNLSSKFCPVCILLILTILFRALVKKGFAATAAKRKGRDDKEDDDSDSDSDSDSDDDENDDENDDEPIKTALTKGK